jgi:hypothetical protein
LSRACDGKKASQKKKKNKGWWKTLSSNSGTRPQKRLKLKKRKYPT